MNKHSSSADIRTAFLEFFRKKDHEVVASSPLVPANDPTLLFTNAGMVQFKDVFLGKEPRPYTRATTSQRCVRAGGKHNDLENVGYTARHHTFFEMLGNFSFGDYFKEDAIRLAWAFLTESLGLAPERLWVTVFREDDEAAQIWIDTIGIDPARVTRMGEKDNFWSMGDTGPCGPCSEIFYDHGEDVAGGPPGTPDEDGDRYVEVWNLVFMQFDRSQDGSMKPLPKPSVDTGMGLERMAAVMQGVHSNYDIDLFARLIDATMNVTGATDRTSASLRVIADHIRACTFLIIDGVLPSREGRGYVLRRIIRRAIRHGYKLGVSDTFFYRLVEALARVMGDAYPEIQRQREHVERVLRQEEERFALTLSQGMGLLEEVIEGLDDKMIPGETVFRLYDTYGFPMDLTADIARERGLTVDEAGFEHAMEAQRERARAASKFGAEHDHGIHSSVTTQFDGYGSLQGEGKLVELYVDGAPVERIEAGQAATLVADRTPFYAESGGQVGDTGIITSADGASFAVSDTQKVGDAFGHIGTLTSGSLALKDSVSFSVDARRRQNTVLNHSATHLLHAALRQVLGDHVTQKGSLVGPDKLRFDFSHYEPVTREQLAQIESLVNAQIRANAAADTNVMTYDEAIESGAMALFGEKYADRVRVLKLGDFSTELCGGTHVSRVGDIGLCKITQETGIAAGVRRIEAITGDAALEYTRASDALLQQIAEQLKASRDDVAAKVGQAVARARAMEKEVASLKQQLMGSQSDELAAQARDVAGLKVLAVTMEGADAKQLRAAVDKLKDQLGNAVIVLGAVDGDKVRLVAGVSKGATSRVRAGEVIAAVAAQVGGRGGGRPDLAQAGGTEPGKLPAALASVYEWVGAHAGA